MQQIQIQVIRPPVTIRSTGAPAMRERALRFGCHDARLSVWTPEPRRERGVSDAINALRKARALMRTGSWGFVFSLTVTISVISFVTPGDLSGAHDAHSAPEAIVGPRRCFDYTDSL